MRNRYNSKFKNSFWGTSLGLPVPLTFNERKVRHIYERPSEQHSFHLVDLFFLVIFTTLSFFQFFLYWFHAYGPKFLFFGLTPLEFSYYFGPLYCILCIFWWCLSALCRVFKCRKLYFLHFVSVQEYRLKLTEIAFDQLGVFVVYYFFTQFFYATPWIVLVLLFGLNQLLLCLFFWPPVARRVIYQILIFLFLFSSINLLLFSFWYKLFQADTLMTVCFACTAIFYTVLLISLPLRRLLVFLVFFVVWYKVFRYSVVAMFFFTDVFIWLMMMDWNHRFMKFLFTKK